MSLKGTVEFYKQAEYLHKLIDDAYNDFESGKISDIRLDTAVNKTLNDINRLINLLNRINIQDLQGNYPPVTIENIKHNINFFYEASDYIEKYVLGKKYGESLLNGVTNFLDELKLNPGEYKHWVKDETELAKKFTAMLLHPNNINQFINQIKRMALGTMSLKEFKKIFETNKGRMLTIKKVEESYVFESFEEYKNEI